MNALVDAAPPSLATSGGGRPVDRLEVDVGDDRSYPILVGSGLLDAADSYAGLPRTATAIIVTNSTVGPLYTARLRAVLAQRFRAVAVVELPDGEAYKNWPSIERIVDGMLDAAVDRKGVVFALGGGVVGDLAGFAAASYMRGIAFVQVPTTLLAQVDSSVGGKTGINHVRGKNLIGAFHQPRLVVIDLDTLDTLPQRELLAGLAEVIKYGVALDRPFFEWIEANRAALLGRDKDALRYAVMRSCAIKADMVGRDEREAGMRALLNYGHTFGHAIEACTGYGTWLHGEGVACGMVIAADLSARMGLVDAAVADRVRSVVAAFGLPVRVELGAREMIDAMRLDKKAEGGAIRYVLLDGLGSSRVGEADERLVEDVLKAAGCSG